MLGGHRGCDAAAHVELGGQAHEARRDRPAQVAQDPVGDGLVELAAVAERPDVSLQAFQFNAQAVGHVFNQQVGEVGLAGQRAQAGEFGDVDTHGIIPARFGVVESLKVFA